MKNRPTPSMTTSQAILHILNTHFSFISSLLIGTVPIYDLRCAVAAPPENSIPLPGEA